MDSITQAALGGAIGEAILGGKVGNKAILWGIVVGTLPDLDVVINPLVDEVAALTIHRGYSHSILVNLAAAPVLGWVLHKIHPEGASMRDWIIMCLVCLQAAIWLDTFTVYGTQLLLPFSNYPVAFNSISIIDPLITVPLLLGSVGALVLRRYSRRRRIMNHVGLWLGILYLIMTLPLKAHVDAKTEEHLAESGISYERYMTAPTFGNVILWRYMADVDTGFVVGYYSLAEEGGMEQPRYLPQKDSLLDPVRNTRAVQTLLWFSKGYYLVRESNGSLQVSDLRFGELVVDLDEEPTYIFTWELYPNPKGELTFRQLSPAGVDMGKALEVLITRIGGQVH